MAHPLQIEVNEVSEGHRGSPFIKDPGEKSLPDDCDHRNVQ